MPTVVVALCLLTLVVVLAVAVIQSPLVNGMGFLLFLAGVPIYWAGNWCKTKPGVNAIMGKLIPKQFKRPNRTIKFLVTKIGL